MSKNVLQIQQMYCLQRVEGGYMPVNSEYRPVGIYRDVYVDYDDFPDHILSIQITPAQAKHLSYSKSDDINRVYLYNKSCPPFRYGTDTDKASTDYLRRLSILDGMLQEVFSEAA